MVVYDESVHRNCGPIKNFGSFGRKNKYMGSQISLFGSTLSKELVTIKIL